MTEITLYTHNNTPAAHINPPIYAKRGSEWFVVNAFTIRRIRAPAEASVSPVNERVMFSAGWVKERIANAQ